MGIMKLIFRNILPHFSSSRVHSLPYLKVLFIFLSILSIVSNKCFRDKVTEWNNKSELLMEICDIVQYKYAYDLS